MGDGEINEGSVWEAALCAGKHKLSNLTAVIDYNKIQSAGPTREIQDLEPLLDKWRAFNFAAVEVDGHDVEALRKAFRRLPLARRPAERHHLSHGQGQGHRVRRERRQLAPQIEDRQRRGRPDSTRPWSRTCAPPVSTWSMSSPSATTRVMFIGSDLSPGLLAEMQQGNAGALVHGGHHRGQRHRHGRRLGDGRLHSLRQHHRDLHHPALLRAGGGRSVPA